ncbi:PD-(D/E)XK nuclease-like domain-containing protein [Rhodopseudomonas palustris]|nr:PD-(D/E)XK nuclease-like domain-containing protein [Rhodopseudomonas palustris]
MKLSLPITAPGIYPGVPMDIYHSQNLCDGPSISSSGLRKLWSRAPAHFYSQWDGNPEAEPQPESEALILGRAAHHLLLGEEDFSTLFIARPLLAPDGRPWNGNNKSCIEWLKEQKAAGRTVLRAEQLEAIRGMARSLVRHPLVQSGILTGQIEQTVVARDPTTNIWLKIRPDAIPNDSGDFADLKTTEDVSDDALQRTIGDYGYQQQGALVGDVWRAVTKQQMTSFSLIFVEKKPPHCVRVISLKDDDLERGRMQNIVALKRFATCLANGEWPGPGRADAEYLGLTPWAQKKIDFDLDLAKKMGEL